MLQHCLRCQPLRTSLRRVFWPQTARRYQSVLAAEEEDIHRIRPQLNYKYLADHADAIEQNMKKRNYDGDSVRAVRKLYTRRETILAQATNFRTARDQVNQAIRSAKTKDERQRYINEGKQWKERLREIDDELGAVEMDMEAQALLIPNGTHPGVPVGPEENARVLKTVGSKRAADFPLLDHLTLAERLDMLDFEQAALVSGSKFYYLKNSGVWLEFALIQYALEKAAGRGFTPVITPDVVRTSIAYGCGFQPRKKEASQIYDVSTTSTIHTSAPKLCLAGTAEIPLAGMFAKSMPREEELPKRVVGFGRAFRAEAGHGSAEERGLYRVHQFSKVELFAVTTPSQSETVLEEFRDLQEELFGDLGLCFRILDMPTEELGASAYRKYDIEAWMPGREAWGEISSTSNCTDYQTRRLDIRYLSSQFKENVGPKDVRVPWHIKEKWVDFCHTLNGTAMAVPRVMVALLETHQQQDGSIAVPPALRKWIPGQPSILR
ncbi:seryl-tRNA synthetase [Apophysomyces sp. BC1034]|nr:seryl-tRNA synthetase [Apophysomyces sp. BC1015]KAG0182007.1 seryl-tRNA synthetase [Apophysomyces sp. BC1021]KAG0186317.1 seryl-tRNA synthetase [Apophysomyces sp. BC1034]